MQKEIPVDLVDEDRLSETGYTAPLTKGDYLLFKIEGQKNLVTGVLYRSLAAACAFAVLAAIDYAQGHPWGTKAAISAAAVYVGFHSFRFLGEAKEDAARALRGMSQERAAREGMTPLSA
jgi:hypothetical protein